MGSVRNDNKFQGKYLLTRNGLTYVQLETDSAILISKARDSLIKYQHQLVIGNLLNTRKFEVVLVTEKDEVWVRTEGKDIDIESLIIPKCIELHQERIKRGSLMEHVNEG
jgi:phosphopantothenate---cysteine ligase (ATP)